MVDFKKRLNSKTFARPIDPLEIYETLDRASDKGPLRPAQSAILLDWHEHYRNQRDLIVKLHTGQGKTLIGLLMLQSRINEMGDPVVYLCPNNFLINQTCAQATQFGISHCRAEDELPIDFIDGKSILVTSVQKLFNGMTKFGLYSKSILAAAVLIDDAHACIDAIRNSLVIRIPYSENAYREIRDLFKEPLKHQGLGTFADITKHDPNAFLPVPYWEWQENQAEVVGILAKYSSSKCIRYAWPLIKDMMSDCQCIISGAALEIAPYLPPLDAFGTFHAAKQRVFMSATVTNDSFLIKGLGLAPETVKSPLVYREEKWSGEKMILVPSLIDETLDRSTIVTRLGKTIDKRRVGIAILAPSFEGTRDWEAAGAVIANKDTIDSAVSKLISGECAESVVFVNRYDGIDLPDNACRILVFDSMPYAENLVDRYAESCRDSSEITAVRTARTIEQGLGRTVRGEKDYCAIIITGAELVRFMRTQASRKFLSDQTRTQIEIGLDIVEMARDDMDAGDHPWGMFKELVSQCLQRDDGWKAFYTEKMMAMTCRSEDSDILDVFALELDAERKLQKGDIEGARNALQGLINDHISSEADKGWYLQEMARCVYRQNKGEAKTLQIHAHDKNRLLMRPRDGMQVHKITVMSAKRVENIHAWIRRFEDHQELNIALEAILTRLRFGVHADRFEDAFNLLAPALGFAGERPDKEWKEGPDNLWSMSDDLYLLVECKNEVSIERREVNEDEMEQMNRSVTWFGRYYSGVSATNVMIIPAHSLAHDAAPLDGVQVQIMDESGLNTFTHNVRQFFAEFRGHDFSSLSERKTQEMIQAHKLSVASIVHDYTRPLSVKPRKVGT